MLVFCILLSCQKRKVETKESDVMDTYEIGDTIHMADTLQALCLDLDFEANNVIRYQVGDTDLALEGKTIIQYDIDDIDWEKVDFDKGLQVSVRSQYFKEKKIFIVGLTAREIPIMFRLKRKSNTLQFEITQLFNTVYEDIFVFRYDKNKSEWILDKATLNVYTHQGEDFIYPYVFDAVPTKIIDVRELQTGEGNVIKR